MPETPRPVPGTPRPELGTTVVRTPHAPAPAAGYSQAVRRGNILAVSGQVGHDPATGTLVGPGFDEQARQVFANALAVLQAAGAGPEDVVMVRVYLAGEEDFAAMNELFAATFPGPAAPARTTVWVNLPFGLLIEVDLLAVLG